MEMNFTVNPYYLASLALAVHGDFMPKDWVAFRDEVLLSQYGDEWDIVKKNCYDKHYSSYFNSLLEIHDEKELSMEGIGAAAPLFKSIFESKEFRKLYYETVKYKDLVEAEWRQNQPIIKDSVEQIIGYKLSDKNIEVSIVHPLFHAGFSRDAMSSRSNKDYIVWGHLYGTDKENYPNYNSIYLTHEMLHIEIDYNKGYVQTHCHSLIELLADNEIRLRLNGEGKYFDEKWQGHPKLQRYEELIYPYWILFINRQNPDFKKQVENTFQRDGYNHDIEYFLESFERHNIKDMNIIDFEYFLGPAKEKKEEIGREKNDDIILRK